MKRIASKLLIVFAVCVLIQCTFDSNAFAEMKRHFVLYGGISDSDVNTIAHHADVLVVGNIKHEQLKRMKQINPKLIILKYQHCTGMHKSYPEWNFVNQHENWFAHDRISDRRLVAKKHGWYLMNLTEESWIQFRSENIALNTEDLFDGIFLDDFWDKFVNKFVGEETKIAVLPKQKLVHDWDKNMLLLLKQLRKTYTGLIFINGAHEKYIRYVDGCMEESFVHSSWNSDSFYHNPGSYIRSLIKIQTIKRFGKTILVQSGTKNDGTGDIDKLYRYCFASYLLVCNEHTSFGFQPSSSYYFRGLFHAEDYKVDLGEPQGKYYVYKKGDANANLVPNGDFNDGLDRWEIINGRPSDESRISIDGKSINFQSDKSRPDQIRSEFIPVMSNRDYAISIWCRAENNNPGSSGYKKLGMQGRFYDKEKNLISGVYDLQFDAGKYNWLPFEITYSSPGKAAYFRITLGFIGDGMGKGWIDNVYFGLASKREIILRRDFQKGFVLVNYGNKNATVVLNINQELNGSKSIKIKAREGKILLERNLTDLVQAQKLHLNSRN